jgi:hypothetical protein
MATSRAKVEASSIQNISMMVVGDDVLNIKFYNMIQIYSYSLGKDKTSKKDVL